jgi:ATP-binding cassette subfamily B protein
MEQHAELEAHVIEQIGGVETLKSFRMEHGRGALGEEILANLSHRLCALQHLGLSVRAFALFLTGLAGAVVLWYGGHRVFDGQLTIGQLMFFNSVLGYLLTPVMNLATANQAMQEASIALDRLYQVLSLDIEEPAGTRAACPPLERCIEFKSVSFRYGCRETVLHGVDLTIPAGATVALVGESGSGKTTLLKLLLRFYDPQQGVILFDGIDLRDLRRDEIRSRIGIVSQDPFIFAGTIAENIALGNPDAGLDKVIAAARAAELDAFVQGLPSRYHTMIGERGTNLSGGQRQRLALARVLLLNPEVIVLDEATSHLDTTTEQAIQRSLHRRFRNKTVLMVAHRLSTIRHADLIYVLRHGRVVEQGSHQSLLAAGGSYARLWHSQSETVRVMAVSEEEELESINGYQKVGDTP